MIGQLKDWVKAFVYNAFAQFMRLSYYSNNSATGTGDSVECDHTDTNSGSYLARRMQHFGFRSRPPAGVEALRLAPPGNAANAVIVAEDSTRYGPQGLNDGEVCVYNSVTGTTITLDKNGNVSVQAGTGANVNVTPGSGGSVVLANGVLNVARQTDTAGPYPIAGGNPFVKA